MAPVLSSQDALHSFRGPACHLSSPCFLILRTCGQPHLLCGFLLLPTVSPWLPGDQGDQMPLKWVCLLSLLLPFPLLRFLHGTRTRKASCKGKLNILAWAASKSGQELSPASCSNSSRGFWPWSLFLQGMVPQSSIRMRTNSLPHARISLSVSPGTSLGSWLNSSQIPSRWDKNRCSILDLISAARAFQPFSRHCCRLLASACVSVLHFRLLSLPGSQKLL